MDGLHELTDIPAKVRKAIWILIEVAQHDVMLSIEISIARTFSKDQRIQEHLVYCFPNIAKQRPPPACQRFLLDFAQKAKQFLPSFTKNDFLRYLESRNLLAVFERLLQPNSLVAFKHHPAAFHELGELRVQLDTQEFDNCQSRQHVHGDIVGCFGTVQRGDMSIRKQRL